MNMPLHDWITCVLERHEAALLRFATRLTGCPQRAADAVQDAFIALCRQDRAAVEGRLPAWLYTAVRHRAIDGHRKEHRMSALPPDEGTADTPDPSAGLLAAEHGTALHAALATLSPRQREMVLLKFQDGLRYSDIAAAVGCSPGTVAKTIHEALARLRALGPRLQEALS